MNKKKAENKKESLSVEGLASDEMLENVSGGWRTGRFIKMDPGLTLDVPVFDPYRIDFSPAHKERMLNTEKN